MKAIYWISFTIIASVFFISISMTIGLTTDILPETFKPSDFASPALGGLQVPERGFISSEPAETWEQGLISGNGSIGANVLSRPLSLTFKWTE